MPGNRVSLVGLPSLLRDLIAEELARDPGLRVDLEPDASSGGDQADVLIVGEGAAGDLLSRLTHPRAAIVLVDDGRRAELVEVVVNSRRIGELTLASLAQTVRRLAGADADEGDGRRIAG